MAVITSMPSEAIISGYRGSLDYYYNMGLACVRRWPRSPGHLRTPAVMSTWEAFAYASRLWKLLSPEVQRSYEELATGTGLSGRDMAERAYLKGLYAYPTG
ncbi:hypothetical protein ES703_51653 [subsurface metagenome]